ncbi:MAG: Stp1/IreP family PP2C-type Ser/Thr phosphatase [Candidatus Alcyoniella australis]|nr:Stp1/IreP family PP2C-type Ser/Thr phosphatase [Candidatus Alcyoniella australis]
MVLRIHTAVRTDKGLVRANNEDSLFSYDLANLGPHDPELGRLYVVADGMGGVAAGEVASRLAAQTLSEYYTRGDANQNGEALQERLVQMLLLANERIREHVADNPECFGMGTTITALLVFQGEVILAHVGDSRAYLLRDGELYQLSKDHSEVQLMVEMGRLTPEQAREHPRKHILTQAVGVDHSGVLNVFTRRLSSLANDIFLLCSDGLTDMLDDKHISELLKDHESVEDTANALIKDALAAGGRDNITVVLIKLLQD